MNLMLIYSIFMFLISKMMFIMSIYMYLNMNFYIFEWNLYYYMSMKFNFIMLIDFMSLMYLWVVLLISSTVMIYSIEYMAHDKFIKRFNLLLILFVISMCLMILSPTFLSILLGWDGLGLISYCLVIYYQNSNAFNSGMLTILCNRIGDIGLLMLICLYSFMGSWSTMFFNLNNLMTLMILLSIFTKSAQMPFSSWLPAAMTAPTPISSLVHSSTLVTAGVYLLIRYYNLLNDKNLKFILYISIFTMFMASLIANFEFDLKKIIALSTLSQLGFMMTILSMKFFEMAFFHLIIHALFKSLMFLCAGKFIHLNLNNQDIRYYGNILNLHYTESFILIISILSLCGFPFICGFYSKDLIIEYFFSLKFNYILLIMFYFSMIMTLSYSFRLIFILMKNTNFMLIMNKQKFFLMKFCLLYMYMYMMCSGLIVSSMFFNKYMMIMILINKLMILKIYILGVYFGFMTYHLKFKNLWFLEFMNSMFYLSIFFKKNYLKIFKWVYIYEKIIEKNFFELMMGLFMFKLMNIINKTNFKKKINLILIMNFYLMMILMLIMIN